MPDPFDLLRLRDAARAAPSILNTKPWVFRIVADDCIQLYADPRSDPNYPGRKLYLKVTGPLKLTGTLRRSGDFG